MKLKSLSTSLALLALALLVIPAAASAEGSPDHDATGLSIQQSPVGLYGALRAPNGEQCGAGRGVVLYRMVGDHRDPGSDHRVGDADASHVGDASSELYMWSVPTKGTGTYYAVAAPEQGCAEIESDHVEVAPGADNGPIPECPDSSGDQSQPDVCHFGIHLDAVICPSFSASVGGLLPLLCVGSASGNTAWAAPFSDLKSLTFARLSWYPDNDGRIVAYHRTVAGFPIAGVEGHMKGPQYAEFDVTRAFTAVSTSKMWATPAHTAVPAGEVGGPLYLDFQNGHVGADVYIHGYLFNVRG